MSYADSVRSEELIGAEDKIVLAASCRNGRVLLTLDKGVPQLGTETQGGIVLFRPGSMGKKTVLAFVRERLRALLCMELEGRITVVTATRVRVRLLHT